MKALVISAAALLLSVVALSAAPETMRRYVLAAGANSGGEERIPLRYALSDAEKFAEVMVRVGGVAADDVVLLKDPNRSGLSLAMRELARKVEAQREHGRTEVLVYYSGHADESGLMLGEDRVGYRDVRSLLDGIPADVRIAVLDACASGAITRIKGGTRRRAFQIDTSDARGYAFLTSSSAEETAQESDRIRSSFFTHYLVSGMSGAADASGDGKVTLSEAYQFAFRETLARTVETQAGAQHPAYQINLSGTGDIVMTDVRQTSAGLVIGEEVRGRLFIQNRDELLVAELYKQEGRSVELGLAPGTYEIHLDRSGELFRSVTEVAVGERAELAAAQFKPAKREPTVIRGGPPAMMRLAGKIRIELHLGRVGPQPQLPLATREETAPAADAARTEIESFVPSAADVQPWSALAGLGVGYWVSDQLAVTLRYSALGSELNNTTGPESVGFLPSQVDVRLSSVLLGASRYFDVPGLPPTVQVHLSTAAGTYLAREEGRTVDQDLSGEGSLRWRRTSNAFGGQVAAGFDMRVSRRFMAGARVAYNAMADFDEPLAGRSNYNGGEFSLAIGWVFGSSR